ncbi:nucleotide sugar dehydrogenase [Parvularcula sp. ZS-1/3]|uniref:Nucleotide sugar dehydrogenase n=1 Tax=Parvularcula mediterranea TaxID=2732508 RepID=A0A7Y3RIQ0_9PROT|nr:nucleotide sugar dehydrogenase [Parvularcula mediterranea]NNU14793.1 nucleotide sugar dehydrogenase [Parvularcula mediterranea]
MSLERIADDFVTRAEAKDLTVGVIGLGYVGLPLSEGFVRNGHRVLGFDVDEAKCDAIREGRPYFKHIGAERMEAIRDTGFMEATTDFARLSEVDAVLICVPTPLNLYREPDLSFVTRTCETIAEHLRPGQLVVLESTTYPGTTEEVMAPILERSGLKAGVDFAMAYSPEREDPGNQHFETTTIPKVVGAPSEAERKMAVALYSGIISEVVPVSSAATAEAVKLTENIFRSVNIALVNELKVVFQDMGIDVWEVIDAAKTKPFGFMPFYPGPGLGGHCIPIDPFYLTWKAREFGHSTRFIELAGEINTRMPEHVIERLGRAMNDHLAKAIRSSKVLVIGLAYKKNVDDTRESPSLELIDLLIERGADVTYYDPFIPVVPLTRKHAEIAGMESASWTEDKLKQFDVALIATDHDGIDYKPLLSAVPLVVDTRNALHTYADEYGDKIVKA